MPEKKVEHLVVDTTAFVKNKNVQDIASEIYTVQGVVDEIKNKRQLRRLVVLPYDLKIKDVFPENIKFVTDFSKKTGDYPSLSAIDIQVCALTYQLEKEHVGTEHLKSEPIIQKVVKFSEEIPPEHNSMAGFYMPSKTILVDSATEKNKYAAPEDTEEEGMHKPLPLNVVNKQYNALVEKVNFAPGEEDDAKLKNQTSSKTLSFYTAPGDTEEDAIQKSFWNENNKNVGSNLNAAPEDIEEEAIQKSIFSGKNKHVSLLLKAAPEDVEDEAIQKSFWGNKHVSSVFRTAPEDIEDEAMQKPHWVNKHISSILQMAPEDVEDDVMQKSFGGVSNKYVRSIPEDVDEEATHSSLLKSVKNSCKPLVSAVCAPEDEDAINQKNGKILKTHLSCVPEDVEEDAIHKNFVILKQKVNVAPEDTEDAMQKPMFAQFKTKVHSMSCAPEDVEEEGKHSNKLAAGVIRPLSAAPEDVEEDAVIKFGRLTYNRRPSHFQGFMSQSVKFAPEDVEDDAFCETINKYSALTAKNGVKSAPEDEADDAMHKEITPEYQHPDQGIKCDAKNPELKPENLITPPEVESSKISKEELGEEIKRNLALEAEAEEVQAVRDLEEALRKAVLAETPDVDIVETGEWPNEQGRASDEEGGVTSDSDDSDIWDDTAWITPENIDEAKCELQGAVEEETVAKVACITGDFAMQNVLRQMGIKAIAADGRIIKQMRTYIYRCYSCNKTTSKLELLFCPFCGNRTLRKAAVFLKPDGSEEVQSVWRRPPTGRGKKFPLPKPQGGKHANNPLLCPDQQIPQQRTTKLARTRNDPLDPDYIAGFSPFIMRDITSRSAVLGIRSTHTQVKNWMRRNPNEVVKRGKGKKKK